MSVYLIKLFLYRSINIPYAVLPGFAISSLLSPYRQTLPVCLSIRERETLKCANYNAGISSTNKFLSYCGVRPSLIVMLRPNGLLWQLVIIDEGIPTIGGMPSDKWRRKFSKKVSPNVTLSSTVLTWPTLGSNEAVFGDNRASTRLSNGMPRPFVAELVCEYVLQSEPGRKHQVTR